MKQVNHKNNDQNKNDNILKFLGHKTIRFKVEKKSVNKKNSSSMQYIEEKLNEGRWSLSEQISFINALSKHGLNFKRIKETIPSRTLTQIRSHAQKFFIRLKRCKNKELGIDFTNNSIKSLKDMINHIKSVNNNYDVNNIFLYLYGNKPKYLDELKVTDFLINNNKNISNPCSQNFSIDYNKLDLTNKNNLGMLDSLNNIINYMNPYFINNLGKSILGNYIINSICTNYLENKCIEISKVVTPCFINNIKSSNNCNNNEFYLNKK